jgi:ubiquinone biosynthesis protein
MDVLAPYARRLLLQENAPRAWIKRLGKEGPDLVWLATELPHRLRRLLGELEEGSLKVDVQPTGMEPLLRRLERLANRLVLGIIVGALIVGLAMLASAYHPLAAVQALGTVFTVGTIVVVVLGLLLAWSIVRSMRR